MWKPDPADIITAEQKEQDAQQQALENLRAERDRRLRQTDELVLRHRDEQETDAATTLTAEQYADLLAYRQALRDLPEATDDPPNPVWPEGPGDVALTG